MPLGETPTADRVSTCPYEVVPCSRALGLGAQDKKLWGRSLGVLLFAALPAALPYLVPCLLDFDYLSAPVSSGHLRGNELTTNRKGKLCQGSLVPGRT
jgi:hypothetical protein